jgi:hypothetical protein
MSEENDGWMDEDEERPKGRLRPLTPQQAEARALRLARESAELTKAIETGDLTSLKNRVAYILHSYPKTRDSDVALTLKYWELHQPNVFNPLGMMPRDLFRLERFTSITRIRAIIQNEYNLFPASESVRTKRRAKEELIFEAVQDEKPDLNSIHIFADESGKNQDFVCVAAVWAMTGRSVFEVSRAIREWQQKSPWARKELHFSEFKKDQLSALNDYLDLVMAKRELLSFKAITFKRASTRRSVDEIVHRLHEFMVVRGVAHEIESGRISLPHGIILTVDAEQSLDDFAKADIKRNIETEFRNSYAEDSLFMGSVSSVDSKKTEIIQLADVIAGAINRKINHTGERSHKDEMAEAIINRLQIQLKPGQIPGVDATTLLSI